MKKENFIQLEDGGVIAFEEYGDANGVPVIFCHGWPSSRTMARLTDEPARELGIRIISPDRPGISGSSLQLDRKLTDWPRFLERIVDHLSTQALLPLYRWMLTLYRTRPQLLRRLFYLARPVLSLRPPVRLRPLLLKMLLLRPCDAESLRDAAAFEAIFESQRRAWRTSAEGVIADAQIYAQPWGFAIEDVRVAVRLWHGKQDRAFSFHLAEELAKRVPDCKARFVDDAGHYSLPIRHMRAILEDLIHC